MAFAPESSGGIPGFDLRAAEASLVQVIVQVQAEVWKNLVYPYQQYPWRLLRMLHSETTFDDRVGMIDTFKACGPCCLDLGFSSVLKRLWGMEPSNQLAHTNSEFLGALVLLGCSKTSNVEVETNFARATSARICNRGVRHDASTMASKHVISELAHQHNMAFQRKNRRRGKLPKDSGLSVEIYYESLSHWS